ncbi:MAG: Omp28-related outer membrane protein [Flavobacteriales bacterium]|nr:Omp28-related outer membrane protein [Flavobacteriales bacterium]
MKKIIFALSIALGAVVFYSCGKDEALTPNATFDEAATGNDPTGNGGGTTGGGATGGGAIPVGDVPDSFTKKVVLEENTGEWCGWCPEGAKIMEDNIIANPNTVIGIAIHSGDPMAVDAYNIWQKRETGVTGLPSGSIDRADASNRGTWTTAIRSNLVQVPELGIALDATESNNKLNLDVYIGYNVSITENTKLTVVLTENDVDQSSPGAQDNYSSTVTIDANWKHSHVLRGVITSTVSGDDIALNSTEKYTKVSFNDVDISNFNIADKANVHIVAFIHKNETPMKIFNAQQCSLNELRVWE